MNTGDIVLLEHPFMRDEFVMAKLVGMTPKTVRIAYWQASIQNWNEEIVRRDRGAVIVSLGSDDDFSTLQVQRAFDQIRSAKAERDDRIQKARASYQKKIREFHIK